MMNHNVAEVVALIFYSSSESRDELYITKKTAIIMYFNFE